MSFEPEVRPHPLRADGPIGGEDVADQFVFDPAEAGREASCGPGGPPHIIFAIAHLFWYMIRVSGANRNSQTHRCLGQISKETRRPIDYDLFGLSFRTAIPIPGVQPAPALAAGSPAICIDFGPVPLSIAAPCYKDSIVQVTGDEYLFHYPGLVRLYVQGGERIVVEAAPDADPVKLWTITIGSGRVDCGISQGTCAHPCLRRS